MQPDQDSVNNRNSNCEICYQNQLDTVLSCNHSFCNSCIKSFVLIKILEGDVLDLRCPNCYIPMTSDDIRSLVPEETFKKFQNFISVKELLKDKNVRLCPQPDCRGFDVSSSSNRSLTCRLCRYQYCFDCCEPWHKGRCPKPKDLKFQSWGKSQNMKLCPRCRCFVLRNGGCNHMTCSKCATPWCWICGQELSGHTTFNCLFGPKMFDLYWRTIFFCLFFPVTFFYLFFFLVWYFIEVNDVPFKCCTRFKGLNLGIAFLVSPFMGFFCFPVVFCVVLVRALFRNTCLGQLKYVFGRCCSKGLAFGCFWIWYPACFAIFLGFGAALSVFLPVLALFLFVFKIVNCLRS
jgi:hypothetical protein